MFKCNLSPQKSKDWAKGDKATAVVLFHASVSPFLSPWKLDCVGGNMFRGRLASEKTESLVLVDLETPHADLGFAIRLSYIMQIHKYIALSVLSI